MVKENMTDADWEEHIQEQYRELSAAFVEAWGPGAWEAYAELTATKWEMRGVDPDEIERVKERMLNV